MQEFDTDDGWVYIFDTHKGKLKATPLPRPTPSGCTHGVAGARYFGRVEVVATDKLKNQRVVWKTPGEAISAFNKFPFEVVDGRIKDA